MRAVLRRAEPDTDADVIALGDVVLDRLGRTVTVARYGADRPVGTGLGLAVVRELAEALGGTTGVASEPGRGSTFSILLPQA